ncbi:hypothetical protein CDAR_473001 [Caerostris darwini]|uniref:Uncharacterized protein n=1 Tax=Caerostris darwini TaxID=1538125 RepID=A0AAV4V932_9ARAC|nr:hypothetical protein CDAR_473001 [Caerostris darwini]
MGLKAGKYGSFVPFQYLSLSVCVGWLAQTMTLEPYLLRPFMPAILRGNIPPLRMRSANGQILDQDAIFAGPLHQSGTSNGPLSVVVTRECVQCDLRYRKGPYFKVIVPRGPGMSLWMQ